MYGHRVGTYARKPHMDTVQAIRRSTVNPFVTSPAGVPMEIAQPRGFTGNIHNADRILMGDYGQVGGSDSFAAAYPESAAAVPAPTFQLRNTPVMPAAAYQQRSQGRAGQGQAMGVAGVGAAAAAAVPVAASASAYQQMLASQQLQSPPPPVQGSRQVNQNSRAAAAAAARAPPAVAPQAVPNPRAMAPSVTSVRVSDGGGASRSQVVSNATERVQQLYNLSDNDIQNIMRIIQTESANVFGGVAAGAAAPAPVSAPAPAPSQTQPSGVPVAAPRQRQAQSQVQALPTISESTSQVSFSEPVARSVSNRDSAPTPVSGRPSPQQRFSEMREAARREAEEKAKTNDTVTERTPFLQSVPSVIDSAMELVSAMETKSE